MITAEFSSFTLFVPGLIRLKVIMMMMVRMMMTISVVLLSYLSGQAPLLPAH